MHGLAACVSAACVVASGCGRYAFDEQVDAFEDLELTAIELTPPPFMTASPTFVDVPSSTLVVPSSPGQIWLLMVSASLRSTSLDARGPEARYLVDGIERGIGGTENTLVSGAGPWQHVYMFTGSETPMTIVFQTRDAIGGTTAIEQLRAVVMPVPADAAPIYASADPVTVVTSTTFATAVSLTLTPPEAGDYLLMLLTNSTEAPGGSDCTTQWLDPNGADWGRSLQMPRSAWQSRLLLRRASLPAGDTALELLARTGTTAQLQYVRVVGLRVDGLLAYAEASSSTVQQTASAAPVIVNELAPTLASAPGYVVLGTMRVDDNCPSPQFVARVSHHSIDGVDHSQVHSADNCAYETTYGHVGLHRSAPSVIQSGYSSGNGELVEHAESQLVVLGTR